MKNKIIRYCVGAGLMYSIMPALMKETSLSIYNICTALLLIFVIVKDLNDGNKI